MRNGTGERPERPSYSLISIGSSGISSILKAQSMRAMARNTSRSATHIPGQMRRLQRKKKMRIQINEIVCVNDAPDAEHPVVSLHGIGQVRRFR